jgi:hypothetical protein
MYHNISQLRDVQNKGDLKVDDNLSLLGTVCSSSFAAAVNSNGGGNKEKR